MEQRGNTTPRSDEERLSWDEYFMGVALLSADRSADPSTQVGACIVTPKNKIIGTGYNGPARGIDKESIPWDREAEDILETKYPYLMHAERNAILNSTQSTEGCKIYVYLFPCNECALEIIQSGINEVIYISDKHKDLDDFRAAKPMLDTAEIKCRRFESKRKNLVISLDE